MAKIKPLTKEDVAKLASEIATLPKKDTYSAGEVIFELYDEINKAISEKGYTVADILKTLAGHGVEIKESSYKAYMRDAAKRKREAQAEQQQPSNHASSKE